MTVLRLVLGSAGRLIGAGALIGCALALLLAQSISTFLFGVRPLDPLTFTGMMDYWVRQLLSRRPSRHCARARSIQWLRFGATD